MIDQADKQTASLPLEQPKRGRGRPKTGAALTPAQKQKAYRERLKGSGNVTQNTDTLKTSSIELLRERALLRGRTCVAQARMIGELEAKLAKAIERAELEEARANVMGNELAIIKSKISKPERQKKHRDDNALGRIAAAIQEELNTDHRNKHSRALGRVQGVLDDNGFITQG